MLARGYGKTFHIDAFDVTFEDQSWRDVCVTECPLMTQSGHCGSADRSPPLRSGENVVGLALSSTGEDGRSNFTLA